MTTSSIETTGSPIEARDYTYCTAYYSDPFTVRRFLVMTPSGPEARHRAEAYARARWGEPSNVHVYPRNYVKQARALFAGGAHDGPGSPHEWQPPAPGPVRRTSSGHAPGTEARGLVYITHSRAQGTLVTGTAKGDGAANLLKPAGFRWSRNITAQTGEAQHTPAARTGAGAWYVPRSRDTAAQAWRIEQAAAALRGAGFDVTTEIEA